MITRNDLLALAFPALISVIASVDTPGWENSDQSIQ
jgi:hypothetical protein